MSQQNKPDYYNPATWPDELVLSELKVAQDSWTELMFIRTEDQLLPCSEEQQLERLRFWQSRLDLAEPEAKKRKLI